MRDIQSGKQVLTSKLVSLERRNLDGKREGMAHLVPNAQPQISANPSKDLESNYAMSGSFRRVISHSLSIVISEGIRFLNPGKSRLNLLLNG